MENNKQEDFDILFVLRRLKKGVFNLFRGIGWLIDFSIKKMVILLIFIAGCVTVSLLFKSIQKQYYTAELAIAHSRFDNYYCKSLVNNINTFINTGSEDQTELAKKLNLNLNLANQIKNVRYNAFNENLSDKFKDSVNVLLPFKIEVDVYDNTVLDTLQYKLLSYLENNEFASKRKEIDKSILDKTQQKIREEIAETDSLKKLVNQSIVPRASGNGLIVGEPIDPVSVHRRGLELYERNLQLGKKRELNNSFELIFGFVGKSKPANYGWTWYIFVGVFIGYLIGLLFLLRREYKSEMR